MMRFYKRLPAVLLCLCICTGTLSVFAAPAKKKAAKKAPHETSASVRKQEQNVNEEIKMTQAQIEQNEADVKKNLDLLNGLEHDINLQKNKVAGLKTKQSQINADISACLTKIGNCEKRLANLRSQYISVIKKMRIARKKASPMAYIFASKNFYQAWRRMRYFQKFRTWRERREKEIQAEIANLKQLNVSLDENEKQLGANLEQQKQAEKELAAKHAAQDEAVKALRSHGDALRKHLAAKQAEANALSSKVMQLIAQEQEAARIAEQQRKEAEARAAAERKAAEQRAAKERAAREKAEAELKAKEQQQQAAAQQRKKEQKKQKDSKNKKEKKPEVKKPEKKEEKKPETAPQTSGSGNYAEARGRKPRGNSSSNTSTSASTTSSAAATGFAALKGSLPRPVSGQFSIISRFGRHPLPDLPDVVFDNPGIDAVVSKGASAQAVYPGTVTGVYVVSGFSTVVIVCHGEYYTVYGNIGKPAVNKGDKVKQGQALGKLVSDSDEGGRTTIHFEVWKNREKLNPEAWIK
ncbi:MAG: peptidoglycan DD-metalloendopeptidase family protein [Prevotella sp.]|nr:peptidoglycan DD-metalloendopeptidase family protein [Prevotella sp.]MCM1075419.1 peptidoglycan DD-metalloendopeptidase family protein [Ruminococcus sp.]